MINIIYTNCKICGKQISKTNKSIYGLNELKNKYGDICQNCMDDVSKYELNNKIGEGIIENGGNKWILK